jgi:hypothetical protein
LIILLLTVVAWVSCGMGCNSSSSTGAACWLVVSTKVCVDTMTDEDLQRGIKRKRFILLCRVLLTKVVGPPHVT